jgi:hypothetical protein
MFSLKELFCCVDDFCQIFEPLWEQKRLRDGQTPSLLLPTELE